MRHKVTACQFPTAAAAAAGIKGSYTSSMQQYQPASAGDESYWTWWKTKGKPVNNL